MSNRLETRDDMMEEIDHLETELDTANGALVEARRRIAELEGAREKAMEGAEPLFVEAYRLARGSESCSGHQERLVRELNRRADVIAKLRADLATARQISRDMIEAADRARGPGDARAPLPAEKQQGIYRKFRVERTDGSSQPGGRHEHCEYFVLDWLHDKFAVPAARAYAFACRKEFPELARDLRATANDAEALQAAAQPSGEGTGR